MRFHQTRTIVAKMKRGLLSHRPWMVAASLPFLLAIVSWVLVSFPPVRAVQNDPVIEAIAEIHGESSGATYDPSSDPPGEKSEAERIAELQETIESDEKQLKELELDLDDPNGEYAQAEKAFLELDEELDREKDSLKQLQSQGRPEEVERLQQEIASIERKRKLAQERFDLAIESRKTLREQILTVRSKLKKDREALSDLTGEGKPLQAEADPPSFASKNGSNEEPTNEERHRASNRTTSEGTEEKDSDHRPEDSDAEPEETDEELMVAEAEALEKEQEAEEAEEETRSIASRIVDLQTLVNQEQKELSLAKKKMDLANSTHQSLQEELVKRQSENADAAEISDLRTTIADAFHRLELARSESSEIAERLNDHRAELGSLQAEHILALNEAKQKQMEAEEAEQFVESLRNPFAPRNMLQWLLDHGVRLLAIILGMFFLNWIASFFSVRSIRLVAAGTGRGSSLERENRAKTLVGVFQNAATVAIFISGSLMVLEEIGANITVLMGGVAVIGLAVAFGAQNLIKDYFYGFVMLLENQYMLNDTIRIGTVSGQVERITLRMTVLRDANGVVHFIPNGTINSVSNETHGWSRAVCEIAIRYEENFDRVVNVLNEIASELKQDPIFGALMLEPAVPPAIDSLSESAIVLKSTVKTVPNKHGAVKQEWLKRIQRKFKEMGIEPAYPQSRLHVESTDFVEEARQTIRRAA